MGYFGLSEEGYDRIYSDRELFSRILKLFKPYRRSMTIVITFICLSSVTYGLTPYLMSLIIKQIEIGSDPFILIFFIINTLILNSLAIANDFILSL